MNTRRYTINVLSGAGIDDALRGVQEYRRWIEEKTAELSKRSAELGMKVAKVTFSTARYDGDNDVDVTIETRGDKSYAVVASGNATWFIEFGSGISMGKSEYGTQYGMGAGTYPIPPGKGHWNDPRGWYLPKEKGGGHTYGNPPAAAMYNGSKEIELEFRNLVQEVFGSD